MEEIMKILFDAMGGDNAPDANITGAVNAIEKINAEIILIGNEKILNERIKELYGKENINELSDRIKIVNAEEEITMEDMCVNALKGATSISTLASGNPHK